MSHPEEKVICLDYCSHKCPCFLARSGKCPECSILNGDSICRCDWPGFCLLLELQWNRGSFLDSIRTERAKAQYLAAIGRGVLELVVSLDESSALRMNGDILDFVLVRFERHPSVWCTGVCSHTDKGSSIDGKSMHLIVSDYYFTRTKRQIPPKSECTLVWWEKEALEPSVLKEGASGRAIVVGTGMEQVATVQMVQRLQKIGHGNVEVWLSRNAPAVQFVMRKLGSFGIQPELFVSESALLSSLHEFLNSRTVDNVFCVCNTVNCGRIIEIAKKSVCRPFLSFYDFRTAHRVARQLQRRSIL